MTDKIDRIRIAQALAVEFAELATRVMDNAVFHEYSKEAKETLAKALKILSEAINLLKSN